jgi:hypothetical protein
MNIFGGGGKSTVKSGHCERFGADLERSDTIVSDLLLISFKFTFYSFL